MKIVLWRLGSLEHKIFPTRPAIEKLKNMIVNLDKEEINHFIWGPEIDVQIVDVENLDDLDQYILAYKS